MREDLLTGPIHGDWNEEDQEWVSETLALTGDCWLEIKLPDKGRVVIKKSETEEGPYPKALITKWAGPEFKIRVHHGTYRGKGNPGVVQRARYIKIITTEQPLSITYANI